MGSYSRGWDDALRVRGSNQTNPISTGSSGKYTPSKEVVFKVIGHSKTIRGGNLMANYISRNAGDPEIEKNASELELLQQKGMYNSEGFVPADQIKEELSSWNLIPDDKQNFSKAAREASKEELAQMPDAEKYRNKQVGHYVISFPNQHHELTDQQMHRTVQDVLQPFKDQGHHYLYAIHRHQAKPHVHIMMKYRSDDNKRLNLLPRDIQNIREHIAEVARDHGIHMEATRRQEKIRELAAKIPTVEQHLLFKRYRDLKQKVTQSNLKGETLQNYQRALDRAQSRMAELKVYQKAEKRLPKIDKKLERLEKKQQTSNSVRLKSKIDALKQDRKALNDIVEDERRRRSMKLSQPIDAVHAVKTDRQLSQVVKDLRDASRGVEDRETELKKAVETIHKVAREKEKIISNLTPEKHDRYSYDLNKNGRERDSLLQRQVPHWYLRHGYEYENRRSSIPDQNNNNMEAVAVRLPALKQKTNVAISEFVNSTYANPDKARSAFLELAAENTRTAFWYANKRPELFGKLSDDPDQKIRISSKTVHLTKEWKKEALERIQTKNNEMPPEIQRSRLSAAMRLRQGTADAKQLERDMAIFGKDVEAIVKSNIDRKKDNDNSKDKSADTAITQTKNKKTLEQWLKENADRGNAALRPFEKPLNEKSTQKAPVDKGERQSLPGDFVRPNKGRDKTKGQDKSRSR
ncbi:relaxase/mobilization nuclease domain-containing protein [Aestuariispira insulae]|uniref:Relaxase/mobilization nuclease-like protein n=1 Tax=Aestuariispira insulae TaxID=1461337 RepID=A0A3D9H3P7_9PROT|nr:relaxase/mobilization nuclease domain-containing protein [Aestuariispira insulae]RED44124.1 relaxase/mobilization nuclease-like protein [Aestuariispira insulae]